MSKTRHIFLAVILLFLGLFIQPGYGDGRYEDAPDAITHQTKGKKAAKEKKGDMDLASWIAGIIITTAILLRLITPKKRRKPRRGGKLHSNERFLRPTKPTYDAAEVAKIPEKVLAKSPWWNIPEGTRIFIDTCVPMEAYCDPLAGRWFKHIKKNAKANKWKVVILNAVIKELDGLKNNDNEECAQSARLASNILSDLQRSLGAQFVITGEYRTPADDEFEHEMKKGDILCTRDNNLAMRINGHKKLQALGLMDFPRSHQARQRR